jgi:uracil-DNA glycosylase family 4
VTRCLSQCILKEKECPYNKQQQSSKLNKMPKRPDTSLSSASWKEHQTNWNSCTRCELSKNRSSVVLCRGNVPCDILFIGESPSQADDALKRPFSGPAGILLEHWISCAQEMCGVHYFNKAYTNLISCTLKSKDGTSLPVIKSSSEKCIERLNDLVQLLKPTAVVFLGRSVKKLAFDAGAKFNQRNSKIPTFVELMHPAEVLACDVSQQGLANQKCIVVLGDLLYQMHSDLRGSW